MRATELNTRLLNTELAGVLARASAAVNNQPGEKFPAVRENLSVLGITISDDGTVHCSTTGFLMVHAGALTEMYARRQPLRMINNIQIIDVSGPLQYSYSWSGTSYQELLLELQTARHNSSVDGVLIRYNSPGGNVEGMFEVGQAIDSLSKVKPVYGVASPRAYSAAQYLIAASTRVFTPSMSGGLGSIGVLQIHADMSEMLKKEGINITLMSRGKGKTDGNPFEPLSKSAREKFDGELDDLYAGFTAWVSAMRGVEQASVVKLGAAILAGQKAVDAGLADEIGDFEVAFTKLENRVRKSTSGNYTPVVTTAVSTPTTPTCAVKMEYTEGDIGSEQVTVAGIGETNMAREIETTQTPAVNTTAPMTSVAQAQTTPAVAQAQTVAQTPANTPALASPVISLERLAHITALCTLAGFPSSAVATDFARRELKDHEITAELLAMQARNAAANPTMGSAAAANSTPPNAIMSTSPSQLNADQLRAAETNAFNALVAEIPRVCGPNADFGVGAERPVQTNQAAIVNQSALFSQWQEQQMRAAAQNLPNSAGIRQ